MIVRIDDVVLAWVTVITLMTISLVSIKVNDQKALIAEPLFHVLGYESNIRVDAEAATLVSRGVVVASREVDRPTSAAGDASSIDRALGLTLHAV